VGAAAVRGGNAPARRSRRGAFDRRRRTLHRHRPAPPGSVAGGSPLHAEERRKHRRVSRGHRRFQFGPARSGQLSPGRPGRTATRQRRQGRQREKGCQEQAGEESHSPSKSLRGNTLQIFFFSSAASRARCGERTDDAPVPGTRSATPMDTGDWPSFGPVTPRPGPRGSHRAPRRPAASARAPAARAGGRAFAFLARRCYTPPFEWTGRARIGTPFAAGRRDRPDVSRPNRPLITRHRRAAPLLSRGVAGAPTDDWISDGTEHDRRSRRFR
jgi:hypothetical protein